MVSKLLKILFIIYRNQQVRSFEFIRAVLFNSCKSTLQSHSGHIFGFVCTYIDTEKEQNFLNVFTVCSALPVFHTSSSPPSFMLVLIYQISVIISEWVI